MESFDPNKPLFQCTLGDLKAVVAEAMRDNELEKLTAKPPKTYVYGLAGLMNLMGCSISTAERIRKSGIIDEAISRAGNILVIDAELALELLKVNRKIRQRSKIMGVQKKVYIDHFERHPNHSTKNL